MEVEFRGGMGNGFMSIDVWGVKWLGGGFGVSVLPVGPAPRIAHCLWALLAAVVGGTIANALFGGPREGAEKRDNQAQVAAQIPRGWGVWRAVLGLAGCALIAFLGVLSARSAPGIWAGATFLSTCGLLGGAVLGVAGSQGKRRQIWLGAALFGIGYMTLAFGRSLDRDTWPRLPTDHLLQALRRWFPLSISGLPTSSRDIISANARIWDALAQPVSMPFRNETPLEDVLKYMKASTTTPTFPGIPIYIDPIGLQQAERTEQSTVRIDLEGVALKTSLRLCLQQLGLTYAVRNGLLLITSEESAITPVYEDPFLIVGHCLLALLGAGIGGLVAPLFCDARRARAPRVEESRPAG
jgi:hypothetical protein